MKDIKKHIESYGFTIDEIINDEVNGYHCTNDNSKSEFILDFSSDNYKGADDILEYYSNLYPRKIKVVLLIEVKNNANEIVDFVEQKDGKEQNYLIYDKDDEIEFFLKDLWNILFSLKLMGLNKI